MEGGQGCDTKCTEKKLLGVSSVPCTTGLEFAKKRHTEYREITITLNLLYKFHSLNAPTYELLFEGLVGDRQMTLIR